MRTLLASSDETLAAAFRFLRLLSQVQKPSGNAVTEIT